ncbi:MAG TPA: RidA family protein [Candidatus Limnocylindrales bacterium]|nr:RidA family protein [Candidatus Limnocylindrales bacterium]
MIERHNPPSIHAPVGPYSHQSEVPANARWLVMAGQVGRAPDGRVPDDPIDQLELALNNVQRNLEAGGMGIRDLVKVTWYLVGEIDNQRRREVTTAWLAGHEPCSTLVYVARLVALEYRVEIDAWACKA